MNNNAIVNTRLEDLLNVMDARANVNIFKSGRNTISGKNELWKSVKVYQLLDSDYPVIMRYKVIGLSVLLGDTSILIEEA